MKYNYASKSVIGGRTENQDSAGSMQTRFGFASVVCDGMGGAAGGKVASAMAVDIILHELNNTRNADPASALRSAISKASQEIYRRGHHRPELRGMGTTAIAIIINADKAVVAHVGDSRAYQLREGEKVFRTDDHSKVFELVKRGILTEEQARLSEESNVIQRALGIAADVDVEINDNIPFWEGDLFMLCTDGVCGALPEEELLGMLTSTRDVKKLSQNVIEQIDLAGNRLGGGHDNLTVSFLQPLINSKLKVRIDMKTRIVINVLSVWVALLTIALSYVIFLGGLPSKPLTMEKDLPARVEKLSNELQEVRLRLDSRKTLPTQERPAEGTPANSRTNRGQALRGNSVDKLAEVGETGTPAKDSLQYNIIQEYTVKANDTMRKIATELGVDDALLREFEQCNRHISWSKLKEGQVLKLIKVPKEH